MSIDEETAKLLKSLLDAGWKIDRVNSKTITLVPDPDQTNVYGRK